MTQRIGHTIAANIRLRVREHLDAGMDFETASIAATIQVEAWWNLARPKREQINRKNSAERLKKARRGYRLKAVA